MLENELSMWEYCDKKVRIKDKKGFEYIVKVFGYESPVDADNEYNCGELFIDLVESTNPNFKKERENIFYEKDIEEIELIEE